MHEGQPAGACLRPPDRQCQARVIEPDLRAGLRVMKSGQDLDQRGFPGAVGAEQTVHLAPRDRQGNVVQRGGATKAFGQIPD